MSSYNCVLLVDDDGVTNFINHRLVKKLNLSTRIESAINGADALNFLKEFALKNENKGPELIFLDVNMPILNGFEFVSYFEKLELKNKEKIQLIMLTSSMHPKVVTKIPEDIKVTYLEKPLTEEKLIDLLKIKPKTAENNS